MKMFLAIHRCKSNAAYSAMGAIAARKPPETGNGSFQTEPWNHIAPIITRMNQVARCPTVRCAGSCCQFLRAIQMLARRITQDEYDKKARELKERQAEIATCSYWPRPKPAHPAL